MTCMKFFTDGLTPELKEKAKRELGESDEIRTKALIEINNLIKDEPDFFPCTDNIFLLAFLRTKKFDVSKAFKSLQKYYEVKTRYSDILTGFKPSDLQLCLEQDLGYVLEYRDQNNGSVGFIRIALNDIDKFPIEQFIAASLQFNEFFIQSEATQVAGHSIILDLTGFNWRMAKYYCCQSMYTMFDIMTNCMPVRVKGFHVLKGPLYLDVIYSLFKRFMPQKLTKRVHFHGDLKSLHKFITPDILPEEYGGKQGPMSIYGKKFMNIWFSQDDNFIEMNKYGFRGKRKEDLRKIK